MVYTIASKAIVRLEHAGSNPALGTYSPRMDLRAGPAKAGCKVRFLAEGLRAVSLVVYDATLSR